MCLFFGVDMAKKHEKKGGSWLMPESFFGRDIFDFEPFERLRAFEPLSDLWNMPRMKMPKVDLVDEGKRIKVRADLPGVNKEDIKLNVTNNVLSISTATREEKEESGKSYYYKERASSGYYRQIRLPSDVDPKSVKAKFSNGTLEITMNKTSHRGGNEIRIE